jgi:hypothetical protein
MVRPPSSTWVRRGTPMIARILCSINSELPLSSGDVDHRNLYRTWSTILGASPSDGSSIMTLPGQRLQVDAYGLLLIEDLTAHP